MIIRNRPITFLLCVFVSSCLCVCSTVRAGEEEKPQEKKPEPFSVAPLLPPETLGFITIPDAQKAVEKLKQTGLWQIVANPDLRNAFKSPLLKAQQGMALAEMTMGLKIPELLSMFSQGEITFAVLALDKTGLDGRPLPDLLLAVQARDKAPALLDEINKRLDQLNAMAGGQLLVDQKPVFDTTIKTITAPGQVIVIQYAVCDGTVLAALGEGHIEKVLAMRQKFKDGKFPAEGAAEVLAQAPSYKKSFEKSGADTDLMLYVNMETLRRNQQLDLKPRNDQERIAWELLCLNSIRSLSYSVGARQKGFRELLYVDLPAAARKGILALAEGDGLDADALAAAPKNSVAAVALRITPDKIVDGLLELAAIENPNAKQEINAWLLMKGQELNLDLRKEVLGALTGQAVLSLSVPARHPKLPVGFPQPLLSLGIKDPLALKGVLKTLRNAGRDLFDFFDVMDGEKEIVVAREKFPEGRQALQFALVQDKNELLVSIYPLALRQELQRRAGKEAGSLADDADFKTTRGHLTGAQRAMVYVDSGALAVALYDTLIPVAQMTPVPPEVNPMVLPTSDVFAPNLGGTVFGLNMDGDGIAAEGYSATGVISFLAVAAPAAFQARRMARQAIQAEAGKRETTLVNVKEALQAYALDNGGNFPAALKDLQPKYLPENLAGLDDFAYRGKQDAPNKVVAHSPERQRGPISLLLQDGSVVRIGRGLLGRVLKEGYVAQPADKPPAPENKPPAEPPRPPDNNF